MKTLFLMEMYYVSEYTPTCKFLKIINLTLTGLNTYKSGWLFVWIYSCSVSSMIYCTYLFILREYMTEVWILQLYPCTKCYQTRGCRRGHDRMVIGFTTTYAISVYHYWCHLDQGEVYNIMW
jgi:hypothetical protein